MIVDARSLPAGEEINTQICIIGAGAAGLTLACELADTSLQVCLLEAGGFELEEETQDLYAGEIVGHNYHLLNEGRRRSFGGTTNQWAGYCRPLDAIDFEARDYVPDSGWPISRAQLDPFYRRAQKICQVGKYAFDAGSWRSAPRKPFALDPSRLVSEVIQVGPPTRFGEVYRDKVDTAPNIKVLLHANVTDIKADGAKVTELRVASLDKKTLVVKSQIFILATGGIENARILLSSNGSHTAGLGNSNGNVGRYFMDHPVIWNSSSMETDERHAEAEFYSVEQPVDGTKVIGFFSPTPEVQREEKLLNCGILLAPVDLAALSPGVTSAKHILRSAREGHWPADLGTHAGRMLGDIGGLAEGAYRKLFKPLPTQFKTRFWSECPPDAESRVTLGNETDALGLRRVKLDWRIPADLRRTFVRAHELLAEELACRGIGRLTMGVDGSVDKALDTIEDSYHQMGTTRMHESPRKGVVDKDCRVHDVNNLFVAGSSVFPTYGHVNPTLTIVALAVRLADHVKQVFGEQRMAA